MATWDLRSPNDTTSSPPRIWDTDDQVILLCLTLVALVPRLMALWFFLDSPGDGPARAMVAYRWARAPYLDFSSGWPPGFAYLAGAFMFLVRDPAIAGRVLNVVLGTLTVPVWYLLVRRVFSSRVALFSAVILAFVPLHVGLSASSMTEASYLFETVAGLLFLILAAYNVRGRALYLTAAVALVCLSTMTRYEAWLLIPVLPVYYYAKTKDLRVSVALLAVLLVFPVSWTLGCLWRFGLNGFIVVIRGSPLAGGGTSVNPLYAVYVLARASTLHLGWILPAAGAVGVLMLLRHAWGKKSNHEHVLYLVLCCMAWGFDLFVTTSRGWFIYWASSRYYLLGFVLILPLAALPVRRYLDDTRLWAAFVVLAVASLVPVGIRAYRESTGFDSTVHLTRFQPTAIRKIGAWLESPPQRNAAVIATVLEWQSTYLPLFFPEIGSRYLIVSVWTPDEEIKDFLQARHPTLLITQEGTEDAEGRSRLEHLGVSIREDRLIRKESKFRVYALEANR